MRQTVRVHCPAKKDFFSSYSSLCIYRISVFITSFTCEKNMVTREFLCVFPFGFKEINRLDLNNFCWNFFVFTKNCYLFFQWKCFKIDRFTHRIFTKTSRVSEKLELPKRCRLGINFEPRFESVCRIGFRNRIEINSICSIRLPNSNCRKSGPMWHHKSSFGPISDQIRRSPNR